MRSRSLICIVSATVVLSAAIPAMGGPLKPVASGGEIWAFPPRLLGGRLAAGQPSDDQTGEKTMIVGTIAVRTRGPDAAGFSISAANGSWPRPWCVPGA